MTNPLVSTLASALANAISTFSSDSDQNALEANVASAFDAAGLIWPATTAQQTTDYIQKQENWLNQYRDWSTGSAAGGPSSDGRYPISDRSGTLQLVKSPAKAFSEVATATSNNSAAITALQTNSATKAELNLRAPLASPNFTGTPTVPLASSSANNNQIASTAWVSSKVAAEKLSLVGQITDVQDQIEGLNDLIALKADNNGVNGRLTALENTMPLKAPLASPNFTGTPTVPLAASSANNNQIASTQWVKAAVAAAAGGGFNLPRSVVVTSNEFGAKGDGSTDDTAAIQAALNSPHPVVIIPAGTYMISATLVVPANKTIIGYGIATRLKLVASVTNNTNILASSNTTDISIEDVILDGNRENQPSSNHTTCLQFSNVTRVNLSNVHAVGSLIDGLYLYQCRQMTITGCSGYNNGYPTVDASGMNLDTCTDVVVNGWQGYNNGFHGLYMSNSSNCSLSNVNVHGNSFDGIRCVWECWNINFSNVNSWGNGWRGVMFSNGCYSIVMNGVNINGNGRHGLASSELWSLNVTGGMISGNGWAGIATSDAGEDIGVVNVNLGGNTGGQIEQAVGSYIRILNPEY